MNSTAEKIKAIISSPDFLGLSNSVAEILDLSDAETAVVSDFQKGWSNRLSHLSELYSQHVEDIEASKFQCLKHLALEAIEMSASWMQLNDEINYKAVFQLGEDKAQVANAYVCSKILEFLEPLLLEDHVSSQTESIKHHLLNQKKHM